MLMLWLLSLPTQALYVRPLSAKKAAPERLRAVSLFGSVISDSIVATLSTGSTGLGPEVGGLEQERSATRIRSPTPKKNLFVRIAIGLALSARPM